MDTQPLCDGAQPEAANACTTQQSMAREYAEDTPR